MQDAVWGFGAPQQRVRILEAAKAERALDTDEARALDAARAEAAGPGVLISQDEWKIALPAAVDQRRIAADLDPYDPVAVTRYVATLQDAANQLGTPMPREELILRLQALLNHVPSAARAWRDLADLTLGEGDPGALDLKVLAQVEPWFINAVVYSSYDHDMVSALVWGKAWTVLDPANVTTARDTSDLSAADLRRLDEVVNCPLVRQHKILLLVCQNQGVSEDQCGNLPAGLFPIVARLQQVNGRGACQAEASLGLDALAYQPVKITFPAAP